MLMTPIVWIFFMLYSGNAQETFKWKTLIGMLMIVVGTLWYIKADRDYTEELAQEEEQVFDQKDLPYKHGSDPDDSAFLLEDTDDVRSEDEGADRYLGKHNILQDDRQRILTGSNRNNFSDYEAGRT